MIQAPRNLRLKAMVAAVICHPWVGRILAWVFRDDLPVPSRGMRFRTSRGVAPASKAQLFWGLYESAEDRFVRRYLRGDLDTVELGSGIGVISSRIGRALHPGRRLICVEANPELLPLLQANVARNAPGRSVAFVHAALTDEHGKFSELVVGGVHETSRVVGDPQDSIEPATALERGRTVPTVSLEGLVAAHGLGDFALVCDVEGAEAAFVAAPGALARCFQLVIELHDTTRHGVRWNVEALCEALVSKHGMRLVDRYGPVCVFERGR